MNHGIEEDHRGLYGLCVFNTDTTPDDEVLNIFEKFGTVKNWNRVKNLFFIRYSSLQEALDCYDAMQGHDTFTVKAARKKFGDKQDNQRRPGDRFGEQGEMSDNKIERSRTSYNAQPAQRPRPRLVPVPDVPEHVVKAAEKAAKEEIKYYERVVIANLHALVEQGDIYKMCTQANTTPAKITMNSFKRHCQPTSYYAVVEFRTEAEAQKIVKVFNNVKLNGFTMIVASYEKFVEDAKSK